MFLLTFLGTSSGLPTKFRNVSGLAISLCQPNHNQEDRLKGTPWILVDCGEGTQHQLLKTPLKLSKLRAIFITHMHGDHCFGLAGLLATLAMHKRCEPLTIVAPQAMIKLLDTLSLTTDLMFNFAIDFVAIEQTNALTLSIAPNHQLVVDISTLNHRIASYAFAFNQIISSSKLDTAKLIQEGVAKADFRHYTADSRYLNEAKIKTRLVVAGDNDTPELLQNTLGNAQALVHECTYTQAIKDKTLSKSSFDPMHSSAKQIGEFAQKAGLPMLILTHFSARFALFDDPNSTIPNMGHIRTEVQQVYEGNLVLACDLMRVWV